MQGSEERAIAIWASTNQNNERNSICIQLARLSHSPSTRTGAKKEKSKLSLNHMLDSSESKLVAAFFLLYAALGAIALSLIRSSPRHGGNVFLGSSAKRD